MVPERSEISKSYLWNVESIYPSMKEWEQEFQERKGNEDLPRWPQLHTYRNRLQEDPNYIAQTLHIYFDMERALKKIYTYAHLRLDEDLGNDLYKKAYLKIEALLQDLRCEASWIEPELLHLSDKYYQQLFTQTCLEPYFIYLKKLQRMKPHTLSAREEQLLSLSEKPLSVFQRVFSSLNHVDLTFEAVQDSHGKKHELTSGTYGVYLKSRDRKLREQAYEHLHKGYEAMKHTFCDLLKGQIESHVFLAKSRHYSHALEAALQPYQIDLSVYHHLLEQVKSRAFLLHKYMDLRKKTLQVETLAPYDLYVPLVGSIQKKWSYEEAVDLVLESVEPLGEEYQEILRKGLKEQGWVDVYENKRKRGGAYSSGCFDSHPFILMNFQGTFSDVMTLSHEAGHSMHTYFSNKNQPYPYAHYPIFVAEVASTFHEQLLFSLLLHKTPSDAMKAYLLNFALEELRGTLFRQTLFAEFELKLHTWVEKDVPLTPNFLQQEYLQLNREYYGPSLFIQEKELLSIEWARIPHFYYHYYVYQYATGISAAIALFHNLQKDKAFSSKYLSFLSAGGSKDPLDLLYLAGIDLRKPKVIQEALDHFEHLFQGFEVCMKSLSPEEPSLVKEH